VVFQRLGLDFLAVVWIERGAICESENLSGVGIFDNNGTRDGFGFFHAALEFAFGDGLDILVDGEDEVVAGLGLAFVTLQSVVYAGPGGYVTPKKADLEPKGATIYSYEAQSYTLTVTFSDNSIYDVTTDPATVFSLTTSAFGTLNANTYTASGAAETVGIKGLYTFNQVTVFDTTNLFVQKGD